MGYAKIRCPFCDSSRVCEATRISNGTILRCATLGCETNYVVTDEQARKAGCNV